MSLTRHGGGYLLLGRYICYESAIDSDTTMIMNCIIA